MSWWNRRPPAPAPPAAPARVGSLPEPAASWRSLPPIQRVLDDRAVPVRTDFTGSLRTWQDPRFLAPLGHLVSPEAPSGRVEAAATPGGPLPVQRRPAEGDPRSDVPGAGSGGVRSEAGRMITAGPPPSDHQSPSLDGPGRGDRPGPSRTEEPRVLRSEVGTPLTQGHIGPDSNQPPAPSTVGCDTDGGSPPDGMDLPVMGSRGATPVAVVRPEPPMPGTADSAVLGAPPPRTSKGRAGAPPGRNPNAVGADPVTVAPALQRTVGERPLAPTIAGREDPPAGRPRRTAKTPTLSRKHASEGAPPTAALAEPHRAPSAASTDRLAAPALSSAPALPTAIPTPAEAGPRPGPAEQSAQPAAANVASPTTPPTAEPLESVLSEGPTLGMPLVARKQESQADLPRQPAATGGATRPTSAPDAPRTAPGVQRATEATPSPGRPLRATKTPPGQAPPVQRAARSAGQESRPPTPSDAPRHPGAPTEPPLFPTPASPTENHPGRAPEPTVCTYDLDVTPILAQRPMDLVAQRSPAAAEGHAAERAAGPDPTGATAAAPVQRDPRPLSSVPQTARTAKDPGAAFPRTRNETPPPGEVGPAPGWSQAVPLQRMFDPQPASVGDVAMTTGVGHRDHDGSVVFDRPGSAERPEDEPVAQRSIDPGTPPPVQSVGAPPPVGAGAGAPTPAPTGDIDELARRLFDPLVARLRAELWLDRERAGLLTDLHR